MGETEVDMADATETQGPALRNSAEVRKSPRKLLPKDGAGIKEEKPSSPTDSTYSSESEVCG